MVTLVREEVQRKRESFRSERRTHAHREHVSCEVSSGERIPSPFRFDRSAARVKDRVLDAERRPRISCVKEHDGRVRVREGDVERTRTGKPPTV